MVRSALHKMKLLSEAKAAASSLSLSSSSSTTADGESDSAGAGASSSNSKSKSKPSLNNSSPSTSSSSTAMSNRKRKNVTVTSSNTDASGAAGAAGTRERSKRSRHSFIPYQSPESITSILKITEQFSTGANKNDKVAETSPSSSKPKTTTTTKTTAAAASSSSNGTGEKPKTKKSKGKNESSSSSVIPPAKSKVDPSKTKTSAKSLSTIKKKIISKKKTSPKSTAATAAVVNKLVKNSKSPVSNISNKAVLKSVPKKKKVPLDKNKDSTVPAAAGQENGTVSADKNILQAASPLLNNDQSKVKAKKRVKKPSIPDLTTITATAGVLSHDRESTTPKKKRVKKTVKNESTNSSSSVNPYSTPTTPFTASNLAILNQGKKKKKRGPILNPKLYITQYERDPTFEQNIPIPTISTVADSKLIIRAVLLKDDKLLSSLLTTQSKSKKNKQQQQQHQQQQEQQSQPQPQSGKGNVGKGKEKKKDKELSSGASICSLCIPRSVSINRDAFSYAIQSENVSALKLLTDEKLLPDSEFSPFPQLMLQKESTGHGNSMMFGHGLRQVAVGRGGKEGNNAFLKDSHVYGRTGVMRQKSLVQCDTAVTALTFGVSFSFLENVSKLSSNNNSNNNNNLSTFLSNCCQSVVHAVRGGHRELAGLIIQDGNKKGGYGFNQLHEEVLLKDDGEELSPFKSVSIIKKSTGNSRLTPLHCSCINPNVSVLMALLHAGSIHELTTQVDMDHWSLLHYAAACKGSGPLKYLLSPTGGGMSSLSLNLNKQGNSPLHIAVELGRVENVRIILEHELEFSKIIKGEDTENTDDAAGAKNTNTGNRKPTSLSKVNKAGFIPLHIAAKDYCGNPHIFEMLLNGMNETGIPDAVNKCTGAQFDKLSPLMIACQYGHLGLVKYLCEDEERRDRLNIKLELVDRRGRTAIFHAVMNGHAQVVSYLLRLGVNHNAKDSSGNGLLHYAAAYGWYFNLRLLMEAGCSITERNQWKLSPLAVAFMKGHNGLVQFILEQPGVDINSPINDSTGMTLLLETCTANPSQDTLDRIKFLLEEQGADAKIPDFSKNNALHKLVEVEKTSLATDSNTYHQEAKYESSPTQKFTFRAAELLMSKGCDPLALNNDGISPFALAVSSGCFSLLCEVFMGTKLSSSVSLISSATDKNGNTLLHDLIDNPVDEKGVESFYKKVVKSHPTNLSLLKEMASKYNKSGETPLIKLLNRFKGKYIGQRKSNHYYNQAEKTSATADENVNRVIEFTRFLIQDLQSDVHAVYKKGNKTEIEAKAENENENISESESESENESENDSENGSESENKREKKKEREDKKESKKNETETETDKDKDKEDKGESLLHIAIEADPQLVEKVVKLLIEKRPNLEDLNFRGQTPLTKALVMQRLDSVKILLAAGSNVNVKVKVSESGKTVEKSALLYSCENPIGSSFSLIPLLIEKGANVSSDIDESTGNSALHIIVLRTNLPYATESVRKIIEKVGKNSNSSSNSGAREFISRPNKSGRTALHLLVNSRGGETDVSYDLEDLLISAAPETLTLTDSLGRTPLHYCFVKIGKHTDSSFMDPIELAAILVNALKENQGQNQNQSQSQRNFPSNINSGTKVAEYIRTADIFGDSALHYAATRGATISCSFLLAECESTLKNSLIDTPDHAGNTPFGLAVLNGHEGCALQFQQKKGNFTLTLNCDRSSKNKNKTGNGNVNESGWKWKKLMREEQERMKKKTREQIYTILEQVVRKDWQGILHLMHESLKNSTTANSSGGLSSGIYAAIKTLRYKLALKLIARVKRTNELNINNNNSNPNQNQSQSQNSKKNEGTLLHILAKYSSANNSTDFEPDTSSGSHENSQIEIVNNLISKGLDVSTLDEHKSTALIYAAISRNLSLCLKLAAEMQKKENKNTSSSPSFSQSQSHISFSPDSLGRTPFSALFWNLKAGTTLSTEWQNWIKNSLLSSPFHLKGDLVSEYPLRLSEFPGVRYLRLETDAGPSSSILPVCKLSPLIVAVITGNYEVVKWLLLNCKGHVNINWPDEHGRTPIMHACRLNDIKMVKLLLNPSKYDPTQDNIPWDSTKAVSFTYNNPQLNLSLRDKSGFTVIDHLISPSSDKIPSFSYTNSYMILKVLHGKGKANLPLQSSSVPKIPSPLDRALSLNRVKLSTTLQEIQGIPQAKHSKVSKEYEDFVKIPTNTQTMTNEDKVSVIEASSFSQDARTMAKKLVTEMENKEKEMGIKSPESMITPDSLIGHEAKELTILMDESLNIPFDCVMTKVDLSYGIYGMYNFYKMQLLRKDTKGKESSTNNSEESSELILLFTRWGRVGDSGQYQKTPFASMEEAVKEFKKIFKSKSGNEWGLDFTPLPKRYRLIHKDLQSKNRRKLKEAQVDFSLLEKVAKEKSPTKLIPREDSVYDLVADMALVHKSSYGRLKERNSCEELPFSSLSTETLSKGDEILQKIEKLLSEQSKLHNDHEKNEDIKKEEELKIVNTLVELSEEFYTLIPVYGFASEKLTPMFSSEDLRSKQQMIHNILHLEFASTLLLSAQFNVGNMNPVEYIYKCLGGTRLQVMQSVEEESQLILQYIHNTGGKNVSVQNIFRIERPGELEGIQEAGIGNRTLLWHGTKAVNLLSILNKGLQVAPIGAEISGHLFGKGIYFADMFEKSCGYCVKSEKYTYIFLCEVALGKSYPVNLGYHYSPQDDKPIEKLPLGYHSVKTDDSQYEPDPGCTIDYKGRTIPLGTQTKKILKKDHYYGLDFNEYIIFNPKQVCLRYLIQFKN